MHVRTLQRKGYCLKHTDIGWWVDGAFGYLVAGYFASKNEAVVAASRNIRAAAHTASKPAWFFQ